jgi:hypothetical protein
MVFYAVPSAPLPAATPCVRFSRAVQCAATARRSALELGGAYRYQRCTVLGGWERHFKRDFKRSAVCDTSSLHAHRLREGLGSGGALK